MSDDLASVTPLGDERTVEQALTRALRRSIINGELEPGVRLPYRDLAARFNVSVTPVRIALRELVTEGLVELRPHGGARVSPLSAEEVEYLYASRIGFESLLALRGAPGLTDQDLVEMAARRKHIDRAVEAGDVDGFLRAAWEHRVFCYRAAQRAKLLDQAEVLYGRSGRYNGLSLMTPERLGRSRQTATEFEAACVQRDGRAAETIVREALVRTLDHLIAAFPAEARPTA
jgi:DNA-binding GntR family transcriptional regulator